MTKKLKVYHAIAVLGIVSPWGASHAQSLAPSGGQANGTPVSKQAANGTLEEIIVTAQKRRENVQDVPIAVTALSAGELQSKGVTNTIQLAVAVPSLVYAQSYGAGIPFLRGIGSDITLPNADMPVATYVDGVFISSPWGNLMNLMGVDRVEVLSGPQGTLYGRNATGGAINIYTLTPRQEFEAYGSASFGNYDNIEGSARISGGVTSNLAVGLYAAGTRRKSYLDRIEVGPHPGEPDHEITRGLRGKAVWTPTDELTFAASADWARITSFENLALQNKSPNALGTAFGGIVDIRKYKVAGDWPNFARVMQKGANLRAEFDGSWARFVSITGARKTVNDQSNEIDATTAPVAESSAVYLTTQESQEFQILSPEKSSVQWITGAYYYHERGGRKPNRSYALGPQGVYQSAESATLVSTTSYALFAQATAPLGFVSEHLRLTLGGRYTWDKKKKDLNYRFTLLPDGTQNGPRVDLPDQKDSWSQFTPKVTLDYRIRSTLLYATYSKGFKSGAFNIVGFDTNPAVNPEILNAFEVGSKSDFAGGRVRLNTSFYHYQYKDLQVQTVQNTPTGGTQVFLTNAASAKFYGAEATLTVAATRDLSFKVSGTAEHGRYGEFTGYPGNQPAAFPPFIGVTVDVSGNRPFRTPKFTASGSVNYRHDLSSGGIIFADASVYYNDGFFWNAQNDFRQPGYALVNASIGYTLPGGHWTGTIWATNLTDTYYRNSNVVTGVGILAQDAPPRFFGARISYSY